MQNLILIIVALLLGIVVGFIVKWLISKFSLTSIEAKVKRLTADSQKDIEMRRKDLIYETKEKIQKERELHEQEMRNRQRELSQLESRIAKREDSLEEASKVLEKQKSGLQTREKTFEQREQDLRGREQKVLSTLESVARLTADQAKERIFEITETRVKQELQETVYRIEQEAIQTAEKKAKQLLVGVAQRIASDVSAEITVSAVPIPNEEMKGRIIGREGRNIRAIEALTGADVIIDDTPEAVIVSCFNPLRRAIAVQALTTLAKDGRIHPSRIESEVNKVTENLNKVIFEEGEKALIQAGIQGTMDIEGIRALGRLKYRASFGQNILEHSIEVANLSGKLARELGCDSNIAKRGGLLHDVGKGIETDADLTHVELGVELAKRIKESDEVINCIAAHHRDVPHSCIESVVVQLADSLSASRPGARRGTLDNYIERLEKLENIANSVDGVIQSYAVHAGRELRVILNAELIPDEEVHKISRSICKRIESELKYPGRIKITVIRETKIVEYAR